MAASAHGLTVATLIIYIILLKPVTYCFWKHGKHGFLGWMYVSLLCMLKIVGSAIQLSADAQGTTNTAALIINNIGLSPLLLAAAGILHELYV